MYLALQTKVVDDASTALAQHALTVRVVYHRKGVILLRQLDDLRSRTRLSAATIVSLSTNLFSRVGGCSSPRAVVLSHRPWRKHHP